MSAANPSTPSPPGQERSYPPATKTGMIAFGIPGTNRSSETFYSVWGDLSRDVPPLIALHGGPGSTYRALQTLALLSQDWGIPVILYDQIGCGNSTHFPGTKGDTSVWTFDLFIAELTNLLKHFGISKFSRLGQSWDGMLAIKFAVQQPEGLQKLVLTSTPAVVAWMNESVKTVKSQLPNGIAEVLARCEEQGDVTSPEYQAGSMEFFKRAVCRLWPFPQEFLDALALSRSDSTVYTTLYGPTILHQTGPLKDFDVRSELPLITTNTIPGGMLIISGAFDPCGGKVTQPFVDEIKADVRIEIFALSAHMPLLEETEKCIALLGKFLV